MEKLVAIEGRVVVVKGTGEVEIGPLQDYSEMGHDKTYDIINTEGENGEEAYQINWRRTLSHL
jgi:hypothetical protein